MQKLCFTLKERNEIVNDVVDETNVVAGAPNNASMNMDDDVEELVNKHDEILLESQQEILNKTSDESHELSAIKRIEKILMITFRNLTF